MLEKEPEFVITNQAEYPKMFYLGEIAYYLDSKESVKVKIKNMEEGFTLYFKEDETSIVLTSQGRAEVSIL